MGAFRGRVSPLGRAAGRGLRQLLVPRPLGLCRELPPRRRRGSSSEPPTYDDRNKGLLRTVITILLSGLRGAYMFPKVDHPKLFGGEGGRGPYGICRGKTHFAIRKRRGRKSS